ncbi:MAG: hypothetical protein GY828_07980 [Candidatus Gracilibacteria bacterium]|nr:hypothetical protein [Candidatus Gracilibacteria bacterium]
MGKFKEFLETVNENTGEISVVADMLRMIVAKDRIRTSSDKKRGFAQVSVFGDDENELVLLGKKVKKSVESNLFYKIIRTEDNWGEECLALYITNIDNKKVDKRTIKKL